MTDDNGQTAVAEPLSPLEDAILYEDEIRAEAERIWETATELTPRLYLDLLPLLRQPIPAGFIQHVEEVKGKPYESTGVKSVQVLIDRMDNVLTPLHWYYKDEYEADGKLCTVTVVVKLPDPVVRRSKGGVDRGSTIGNVYKGSFTNAAKLAFARIGPGHEVYLGAADFDPDTDEAAAKAQGEGGAERPPADAKLDAERVEKLRDQVAKAGLEEHLPAKLRGFGKERIEDLTYEQGLALFEWAVAA